MTKTVLCYFESWTHWQSEHLSTSHIDYTLCSHIVYAFIMPDDGGHIRPLDDDSQLRQLVAKKTQYPHLQVLVAVGGSKVATSVTFSKIVSGSSLRSNFINQLSAFIERYHLDGVDLDWEYPAQRGGSPSDKENFVTFIRELRHKLGIHKWISAAAGAAPYFIRTSYNVPAMSRHLDFINLMTYDYHSHHNAGTGFNAPLYSGSSSHLSVDATVKSWLNAGANPSKLLLGVPFYGQTYKLRFEGSTDIDAPTIGGGEPGRFTQQSGTKSYREIRMDLLNNNGWINKYNGAHECPFAYRGNQWTSYENARSVKAKAQYAVDHGLGGVMVWAVTQDDDQLTLLRAINSVIDV